MKFGDVIIVDHKLVRKQKYIGTEYPIWRKYWERESIEPTVCIFLGFRNLTNGKKYTDATYQPTETIRACLVCKNERENPFYYIP